LRMPKTSMMRKGHVARSKTKLRFIFGLNVKSKFIQSILWIPGKRNACGDAPAADRCAGLAHR
jgi:hypothetical protein